MGTLRDLALSLLPKSLLPIFFRPVDFIFIVHPRNEADVPRRFPFARYLPDRFIRLLLPFLWPVAGPKITGLSSKKGDPMTGIVFFCPLTAEQMFADPKRARKKIRRTVTVADKLSPNVIGLGGLIPPILRDSWESLDPVSAVITTGRVFTAVLVVEDLKRAVRNVGMEFKEAKVAVLGAAGLIGSLVTKLIAPRVGSLLLIDRRMNALENLARDLDPGTTPSLAITSEFGRLNEVDFVVAVTNAFRPPLLDTHFKPGTVVIDASQPPNVAPTILEARKDVLVLEGGIARIPGMQCPFDFGFLHPDELFGCLAEAIILCWAGTGRQDVEGKSTLEFAAQMQKIAQEIGIVPADFRSFGSLVAASRFVNLCPKGAAFGDPIGGAVVA